MIFSRSGLSLLLLATWTSKMVLGDGQTALPTVSPTDENETTPDPDDFNDDACQKYECGSYSLASPLYRSNNRIDWKKVFTISSQNGGLWFLRADVSCAFNPGDTLENDTLAEYMNNFTGSIPFPNISKQVGDSKDDYIGVNLPVPRNIHIRIYAIDNDLEFRYRSKPCGIIQPVWEDLAVINFGNQSIPNASALRFVWDRSAIKKRGSSWFSNNKFYNYNKDAKEATLEMWVPNGILETATILGPKYDYSLGIEINGDIVDTSSGNSSTANGEKNTTEISTSSIESDMSTPVNETNLTKNAELRRLLTRGPPQKLSIWNAGIGTTVIVSIDALLDSNTTNSTNSSHNSENDHSDLKQVIKQYYTEFMFTDRSLNGQVKIRTDWNVQGVIEMGGSNTRAVIVRDNYTVDLGNHEAENSKPISPGKGDPTKPRSAHGFKPSLEIKANGFQQVLTIQGNHNAVFLSGESITAYSTKGCSDKEGMSTTGERTYCVHVDSDFTGNLSYVSNSNITGATMIRRSDGSMAEIGDLIDSSIVNRNDGRNILTPGDLWPLPPLVELSSSCLMSTEVSRYNCNPLSSGVGLTSPNSGFVLKAVVMTAIVLSTIAFG